MSKRETIKAYKELGPAIRDTTGFLNGLVVLTRPAMLEIVESHGVRTTNQGGINHNVIVKGGLMLAPLPMRTGIVDMFDRYEVGKKRTEGTLLDTRFQVSYRRQTVTGYDGAYGYTKLNWGYANSSTQNDQLMRGSQAQAGEFSGGWDRAALDISNLPNYYDRADDLREDYARAAVGRIGSGLIVAQTVRLAAEIDGIAVRDPSSRATQLVEMWHSINPEGAASAWRAFTPPDQATG